MHPLLYSYLPRHSTSGTEEAVAGSMNATTLPRHYHNARSQPLLEKFVAHCSPTMIALFLLFFAAETLVLMDPQRIPGWCALGAVISTVFVFVHERSTPTNIKPGFLFLNALCTLFAGIALPRPVLTHIFHVENLGTWYPETFVLVAAVCGFCGFTAMHISYLTITGELPAVIRDIMGGLIQFLRKFAPAKPLPPPSPGPPGPTGL